MSAVVAHILIATVIIFAVNLMPAFGPPNALLLVFFMVNWDLHPVALVPLGAFGSGAGRYLLAAASDCS
ncbi:hypothetical protein ACIGO9_16480 [Nocardia asteroides]|uniref:hypothetical protein n=1 Tax=Nocardia asteroides TaxID=1824 RepID=UPI0034213472